MDQITKQLKSGAPEIGEGLSSESRDQDSSSHEIEEVWL